MTSTEAPEQRPTDPELRAELPARPGAGWQLTLHRRSFAATLPWDATIITELLRARGRRLDLQLNKPAQLTFTLDGRGAPASLINELQHDVIAWRADERVPGATVPYFLGVIGQSEDELTEQRHSVIFTAHDYFAMLMRRSTTFGTYQLFNNYGSSMAGNLVDMAGDTAGTAIAGNARFGISAHLPISIRLCNPDGSQRAIGGNGEPLRQRSYPGNAIYGELIDQLANVVQGFDYDCVPVPSGAGQGVWLRAFYPQQGITRPGPALVYGGSVVGLTRTVNAADYANYVRVVGDNQSTDANAAQLAAERFNADANAPAPTVGLWQTPQQSPDVNQQATLDEEAAGALATMGVLMPSYTLTLRRGFYSEGLFQMGDTLPLIVQSGRLNVNTAVRVVGLSFIMGDDGTEDVEVVVGRPVGKLTDNWTTVQRDVGALGRR